MKESAVSRYVFYALNVALPLLVGFLLYLTLRKEAYISIFIDRYLAVPAWLCAAFPEWLITFLRNFASDILWAYALCFAVMLILEYGHGHSLFAFIICVCLICLVEAFQKAGIFHGTFDYLDILLEVSSVCIALYFIKNYEEAKNEKSNENP